MEIIAVNYSKNEPGSVKFGIRLDDNNIIEAVVFEKDNFTVCLSSQVGCRMGCVFCESGKDGFVRNITKKEMWEQFLLINNYVIKNLHKPGIGFVVIMGIGEPLLNYENIIAFTKKVAKTKKIKIAICTSGITGQISKLIEEKLPVKLCLSLHATNDRQRKIIMPMAGKYDFNKLIDVVKKFEKNKKTADPVDIHYLIFKNFNDTAADAQRLVKYFKNGDFKIIIKSVCPTKDQKFFKSSAKNINNFINILGNNRINYYYSKSRARDIKAGCGQLRRSIINNQK